MKTSSAHSSPFRWPDRIVLRVPLLAFDEALSFTAGLEPDSTEEAYRRNRERVRVHLRRLVARPEVLEALFLGSPSLEESLAGWAKDPESEEGDRTELALSRYLARMAARPTPFGLFAGCGVARVGDETKLRMPLWSECGRKSRLDMEYLCALTGSLARDPAIAEHLVYRSNDSLYEAAGRLRYVESRFQGRSRAHDLVAVESTPYLAGLLERARGGATLADLTEVLLGLEPGVSREEALEFITSLVDNQLLISNLEPIVTGGEPLEAIIVQLREGGQEEVARSLSDARRTLLDMDDAGVGLEPLRYRRLADSLRSLPQPVEPSRLVQVDMASPVSGAVFSQSVVREIARAAEVLHRIVASRGDERLRRFREAFVARYEEREMPLAEVLDEESGIGFEKTTNPVAEGLPLLKGLQFPGEPEGRTAPWGAAETRLLRLLSQALQSGSREIVLTEDDLNHLSPERTEPLPDALSVMGALAGTEESIRRGDYRIVVTGCVGPSGVHTLGRFCHLSDDIFKIVREHLTAEEELFPEAVFAEIVHLPEGRHGNLILRPLLRNFEIPFLGRSGASAERQIPLSDLRVSVRGQEIILWSERLGRRVIPRMTTAHNFHLESSLRIYRFLCILQAQGVSGGLGFSWGASLADAPFLPRVRFGRLILAAACWTLSQEDIVALRSRASGWPRLQVVRSLRERLRLPRFVVLNELTVDLENPLAVEMFVRLLRDDQEARLVEMLPDPSELGLTSPEGRFTHEFVLPLLRRKDPSEGQATPSRPGGRVPRSSVRRSFPPGSEWLYAKLFVGSGTADQLLVDVVKPLVERLAETGADRWFFLRYSDPGWHIRLRIHGADESFFQTAATELRRCLGEGPDRSRPRSLQIDTYERELERYGGDEGILIAERLFHADSEFALSLVECIVESGDEEMRWMLALASTDGLLRDLGLDLASKKKLVGALRDGFRREFRVTPGFKHQLGQRYRKERTQLDQVVMGGSVPGWFTELLGRRGERLRPIVQQMLSVQESLGRPLADLAGCYVHMHLNRIFRSAQRAQELVAYDFLYRLYDSASARDPATARIDRTASAEGGSQAGGQNPGAVS